MKTLLLTVLVAAFYALHQDFWNWRKTEPLALGFLPVGLWYHALYSVGAAVVMAVLVRFAWPRHLETVEPVKSTHERQEAHDEVQAGGRP